MQCCSHHLDISTKIVLCNAMLLTPSWYLDMNYIWQCFAARTILIFRIRLYFAIICCLYHLDILTQHVLCNDMVLALSWYLDSDYILLSYASTILISWLWLYFAMLCCLHNLAISTDTVFAMLCCLHTLHISTETFFATLCDLNHLDISTKSILQCYSAHTILLCRLRLYFVTLCLQSWYLDWDCTLQCYAAHTILISRQRLYFAMLCLHNFDISTKAVFAMLCCLHHLDIST